LGVESLFGEGSEIGVAWTQNRFEVSQVFGFFSALDFTDFWAGPSEEDVFGDTFMIRGKTNKRVLDLGVFE
jgi:hypothetical protein